MKVKGIGKLERHIEKIVLVVAVALLGVVFSLQFLGRPNQVEVGGQRVPPEEAFNVVEREARSKDSELRNSSPQGVEFPEITLVDRFDSLRDKPSGPVVQTAGFGEPLNVEGSTEEAIDIKGRFAQAKVPATSDPEVATVIAAIHPMDVITYPELGAYLPSEQPFDTIAVSVEAAFSGTELADSWSSDPDGPEGEIRSIPSAWWRSSTAILAIRLEREEMVDPGDGMDPSTRHWSNLTTIEPLPGRVSYEEQLAEVRNPQVLTTLAGRAVQDRREIVRPAFYSIVNGTDWTPPLVLAAVDDSQEETLQRDIRRYEKEVESRDRLLEAMERTRQSGQSSQSSFEGEGRRREGRNQESSRDVRNAKLEAQQRSLDRIEANMERLAEQLWEEYQYDVTDPEGREAPWKSQYEMPMQPLLDSDEIRVWSHDLTAEPGKTYRYRLRVVLNNPLYGRAAGLPEDQRHLAEDAVVLSEPSAWSEPVEVARRTSYFVTGASVDAATGGSGIATARAGRSNATVEVFHLYYGNYLRGVSSLSPGDSIAVDIRVPEGLFLFDMDALQGGQDGPGVGDPRQPRPFNQPRQPTGDDDEETDPNEPPEGMLAGPERIPVSLDVFLLDVASAPGLGERTIAGGVEATAKLVYLRNEGERIEIRRPSEDSRSNAYSVAQASYREGLKEVRLRRDAQAENAPGFREDDRRGEFQSERDREGHGGGGHGGGGG